MSVTAVSKEVSISPRKAGVVAALVRNHMASDAITILEHTPRRAALAVQKTIKSAIANAEHNHNYKPDTLKITEITVTPATRLKRYRPVAHGSAHTYMKRKSHIKVVVDGEIRVTKKTKPAEKLTDKEESK